MTAQVVSPEDEVTLISAQGMVLRMMAKQISQQGRATKGTRMMRLEDGDQLRSVARLSIDKESVPADSHVAPKAEIEQEALEIIGDEGGAEDSADEIVEEEETLAEEPVEDVEGE